MHQSTDLYIFTLLANLLRQPISFIYIFILSRCVNKLSCVWLCLLSSLFLGIFWVLLIAQVAFPGTLDHSSFLPLDQLSHSAKGLAPRRWLSGSVLLQLIPFFVATAAFQLLCENNSGPSETVSRTKTNLPMCGDLFDCQRPWRTWGWYYKTCLWPRLVFKVVKHWNGCPDYWVFWLHRPCWTVNWGLMSLYWLCLLLILP